MKKNLYVFLFLFAALSTVLAQPQGDEDPIARSLFPPELVMKYQQDIGLDESQQTVIKNEIQKAQSRFLDLQWQLQSYTEQMIKLLRENSVDEAKVLMQADKVMNLEREIKKTHLSLLIRIKNRLTEQQQAKLLQLRSSAAN